MLADNANSHQMQDGVMDSSSFIQVPDRKKRGKFIMKVRRFRSKLPFGLNTIMQTLCQFSFEWLEAQENMAATDFRSLGVRGEINDGSDHDD